MARERERDRDRDRDRDGDKQTDRFKGIHSVSMP